MLVPVLRERDLHTLLSFPGGEAERKSSTLILSRYRVKAGGTSIAAYIETEENVITPGHIQHPQEDVVRCERQNP